MRRESGSPNAFPQSNKDGIKSLNAVRSGGLSEGGERESCDGPHFLLLVHQPIFNYLHEALEVRENRTAHQDSYLLNNLDPCNTQQILRLLTSIQCFPQGAQPPPPPPPPPLFIILGETLSFLPPPTHQCVVPARTSCCDRQPSEMAAAKESQVQTPRRQTHGQSCFSRTHPYCQYLVSLSISWSQDQLLSQDSK